MILHRRPSWKLPVFLLIVGAAVLAGTLAFRAAWGFSRKMATAQGLQQIMLAMQTYRQKNGCYPPQYLADKEGRPAHSWRVLIWPYLCGDDSYRRYRFDEPWNGPHNRVLASEAPACFRSPNADPRSPSAITDYVGIGGKDTPWRGTTPLRQDEWERTVSNPQIWFVEAANSGITWTEPRDIPLEQALVGINVAGGIQSNYPDGLPAQMMPYGNQWVPVDISPDAFRAMLTLPRETDKQTPRTSQKQ